MQSALADMKSTTQATSHPAPPQACRTLGALAQLGGATAKRLLAHDVAATLATLLRSGRRHGLLCGLHLMAALAAGSDAVSCMSRAAVCVVTCGSMWIVLSTLSA